VGARAYRYAQQSQTAPFETPTDGYVDLGLDLGLRQVLHAATLSWFLKGSNLADAVERRHTSPLKDYAPLPGRSASAGVRVEF
jgi:iron complex outermembrane receptor protein